jgi:hypothetical protein
VVCIYIYICIYIYNIMLFNHKQEGNYIVCRKMDGKEDHHLKWNVLDWERQTFYIFSYAWNIHLKNDMSIKRGLFACGI